MSRCKAYFGGLEVQVSFAMTRSHGTAPDVGQLVWRQGTTQPSTLIGDLVFTNGDTVIVTMPNCMLAQPQEARSQHRDIVYQVMDRRWKWKWPRVFGNWNVRDDKGDLVSGTEKTPRQLASLLLDALGETGYDVTALPTDQAMAPTVEWWYTPAGVELDKLCALFGCSVNLLNDNTVLICTDNTGDIPDDTGLAFPVENGLIINLAPDYISAYANDTLFDSWLTLEPIGRERDGTVKPLELLSYEPDEGWKSDPTHGYAQRIRQTLRATVDEELIDKTIELANRTIYREYRVTGFPAGQLFFPGFTLESAVATAGELPETGDPTKVYLITASGASRTVVWDADLGVYVGVTWRASLSDYALVNPSLISDLNADPTVDEGTFAAMVTARRSSGNAVLVIMEPGAVAVDLRILLPLLSTRVAQGVDESGEYARIPAEICGLFEEPDSHLRNKVVTELAVWKHGLQVDTPHGYVMLGAPCWKRGADGASQAQIFLRCGYRYRQRPYGSAYHRRYDKPTGNTLGTANGVVNRSDLYEYRIQNYTSDYNSLSAFGAAVTNTTALDGILEDSATENLRQYQNQVAPRKKVYTPFRAIDTNGYVMQVTYQGGLKIGHTIASIGGNFDRTQPPAKQKLLMEQQRKESEAKLQEFRIQRVVEQRGMGDIA